MIIGLTPFGSLLRLRFVLYNDVLSLTTPNRGGCAIARVCGVCAYLVCTILAPLLLACVLFFACAGCTKRMHIV
jgi:hypothetical protein